MDLPKKLRMWFGLNQRGQATPGVSIKQTSVFPHASRDLKKLGRGCLLFGVSQRGVRTKTQGVAQREAQRKGVRRGCAPLAQGMRRGCAGDAQGMRGGVAGVAQGWRTLGEGDGAGGGSGGGAGGGAGVAQV